jgi:hypothetical protein
MGETKMATMNSEGAMLLLTKDFLQLDGRIGHPSRRLDGGAVEVTRLRFPPIEELVGTLDHIASRESAA